MKRTQEQLKMIEGLLISDLEESVREQNGGANLFRGVGKTHTICSFAKNNNYVLIVGTLFEANEFREAFNYNDIYAFTELYSVKFNQEKIAGRIKIADESVSSYQREAMFTNLGIKITGGYRPLR